MYRQGKCKIVYNYTLIIKIKVNKTENNQIQLNKVVGVGDAYVRLDVSYS